MKITDFTMDDAKKCAELLALLTATNKLIDSMKLAGISVTGSSAASKEAVLAWVKTLATQMADKLVENQKSVKPEAPKPTSPPKSQKAAKSKKKGK
jgi:hypothetical protein